MAKTKTTKPSPVKSVTSCSEAKTCEPVHATRQEVQDLDNKNYTRYVSAQSRISALEYRADYPVTSFFERLKDRIFGN